MVKVVLNGSYGGFGLSNAAVKRYADIKGVALYEKTEQHGQSSYFLDPELTEKWCYRDISRSDPTLITVVEELGDKANGDCAYLSIQDVPSGTIYRIDNIDGSETIMAVSDYEWITAE